LKRDSEFPQSAEASTGRKVDSKHVLGRDILQATRDDMARTVLPSWISPAPSNWGTPSRGKLSADQWKTVCTIHLPITLIRLWGNETGRKFKMLTNFMDLVTAVQIANMRVTSSRHISLFEQSMYQYLQTLKELYKEAKIKPIHHAALHTGEFLRSLGPVHAYRSSAFERYNNLAQKQNTNMKSGKFSSTCYFDFSSSYYQENWRLL
jgi:hypothetical protein